MKGKVESIVSRHGFEMLVISSEQSVNDTLSESFYPNGHNGHTFEVGDVVEFEPYYSKNFQRWVAHDIQPHTDKVVSEQNNSFALKTLNDVEREHIVATLVAYNGNKTQSCKALGITVKTLYNKLNRYAQEFKDQYWFLSDANS